MYLLHHNPKDYQDSHERLQSELIDFLKYMDSTLTNIRITGDYDPGKDEPQNQYQRIYEHLYTALVNSEKIGGGSCRMEADGKTVYQVEEGKIVLDTFKLHNYFEWREREELKSCLKEAANNITTSELKKNLTGITKSLGNKHRDGSVQLKGNIYNFELLKSGELKIIAKSDYREIFNDTGFTREARLQEIQEIEALSSLLDQAQQESNSQKQKPLRPSI